MTDEPILTDDASAEHETHAPLSPELLAKMNAYWRAANYLSIGQIYLKSNPLLTQPLTLEDIKPRLLGHWGTTPGLNFLYVHLNRAINERALNMIYVIGPGHGGPGIVANTYLEGSYTELFRTSNKTPMASNGCFASSAGRWVFPATLRRRRRGRFTRAGNWATRWCMPSARPSTIPT